MTRATGSLSPPSGGEGVSSDGVTATGADCPDVFELLELHHRWFCGGREVAEAAPVGKDEVKTAEGQNPSREHAPVVFRIVRSEPDAECATQDPQEAAASTEAERHITMRKRWRWWNKSFSNYPGFRSTRG